MAHFKRHRLPWSMNEINRLYNEYEINDQTYPSQGLFLLLVAKHRNGSLGDIPLKFVPENTNITDHPSFLPTAPYIPSAITPNIKNFYESASTQNSAIDPQTEEWDNPF